MTISAHCLAFSRCSINASYVIYYCQGGRCGTQREGLFGTLLANGLINDSRSARAPTHSPLGWLGWGEAFLLESWAQEQPGPWQEHWTRSQDTRVSVLALPLPQAVLGQRPPISEPQLAHLWNGDGNKSSHSSRLLRGSFETKEVKSASSI